MIGGVGRTSAAPILRRTVCNNAAYQRCTCTTTRRKSTANALPRKNMFSTSSAEDKYHVVVSNTERRDVTTITVTGPDQMGILASMTVALTLQGCCLTELHANTNDSTADDDTIYNDSSNIQQVRSTNDVESSSIVKDIFCVTNAQKQQFSNDDLQGLGKAVLVATQYPMNTVVGGTRAAAASADYEIDEAKQIKVVPRE